MHTVCCQSMTKQMPNTHFTNKHKYAHTHTDHTLAREQRRAHRDARRRRRSTRVRTPRSDATRIAATNKIAKTALRPHTRARSVTLQTPHERHGNNAILAGPNHSVLGRRHHTHARRVVDRESVGRAAAPHTNQTKPEESRRRVRASLIRVSSRRAN